MRGEGKNEDGDSAPFLRQGRRDDKRWGRGAKKVDGEGGGDYCPGVHTEAYG
jgi:hypothetical protein